ncbi:MULTISPECIES: hypothetical protein [unclassified Hahella]|uniref:hypothetical protein n=1 Tax=unclassified Hahella TaxID=2624107 RepID=UPI000FDF5AD2|nr:MULTISPECIES: hypothetical protein [unclassified Hahella]AZZ90999.1 hypothetical protein ENC22_07250 [Hahella sp. KA22]MBU6949847.1 hypothetical protein [Hahella sp. HN01]MDG9668360.1 hypothetical protein [Hahella sp. CR1]QAY54369.1 hypothetical protein EUZ85_09805 [Hahella sp. KA22]
MTALCQSLCIERAGEYLSGIKFSHKYGIVTFVILPYNWRRNHFVSEETMRQETSALIDEIYQLTLDMSKYSPELEKDKAELESKQEEVRILWEQLAELVCAEHV